MRKGILIAAGAVTLLVGIWLLRPGPSTPGLSQDTRKRAPETPASSPAGPKPAPKVPGLIRRPDGSSPRSDSLGIPQDSAKIAAGIRERALREYPALIEKLKGTLTADEREALERRRADLPGEVAEWTAELVHRKESGYGELFTDLYRNSPYFKEAAAEYLAASGGTATLVEGLSGADLYARSAAGDALLPYVLRQAELPAATRDAFRKALSDDLSAAVSLPTVHGAHETGSEELAERLRRAAVRVATGFGDKGASALLLDLETGKDRVSWGPKSPEDVDAVYRQLARDNPPGTSERLAAVVNAHLNRGQGDDDPPGNPTSAALLLAALGQPQKLEELKTAAQARFAQAGAQPEPAFRAARALLALRDPRPVDFLIDRLGADQEQTRNQAVSILSEASGQKIGTDRELLGAGSAEDRARWNQVQRQWQAWWAAHRADYQTRNPYAVR